MFHMDQAKYSYYIESLHNLDPENIGSVEEILLVQSEVEMLMNEISQSVPHTKEEQIFKESLIGELQNIVQLLTATCESSLLINELFS